MMDQERLKTLQTTALQEFSLQLIYDERGLLLTDGTLTLQGDFSHLAKRIQPGNLPQEMIVKAAKLRGCDRIIRVVDATAGLGEDSFLLAAAGFRVELYEKDPVIAALLADALERAQSDPLLQEAAGRMCLHEEDSVIALPQLQGSFDIVILDPMFPERKKSGLVGKKFQLLHHLERPCENEEELLEAAFLASPRKIVIKRPLKGPCLAGRKPDYSLKGKAIRYDCIVFA